MPTRNVNLTDEFGPLRVGENQEWPLREHQRSDPGRPPDTGARRTGVGGETRRVADGDP